MRLVTLLGVLNGQGIIINVNDPAQVGQKLNDLKISPDTNLLPVSIDNLIDLEAALFILRACLVDEQTDFIEIHTKAVNALKQIKSTPLW